MHRTMSFVIAGIVIALTFPTAAVADPQNPWCATAPTRVEVDITTQSLYVYENGKLIRSVIRGISTADTSRARYHHGRKAMIVPQQPIGCFKTRAKSRRTFSAAYQVTMKNVVWFIVSKERGGLYGFHTVPAGKEKDLSRPASGGCIRLPEKFSEWFYDWAQIEIPVYIHGKWRGGV